MASLCVILFVTIQVPLVDAEIFITILSVKTLSRIEDMRALRRI